MLYQNQYQKKAHREIEMIFRKLLPENGLNVREEQIRLCHQMLDTLFCGNISLCDAGVGIGKTYAYLTACVMLRKYAMLTGKSFLCNSRPVVISTSSVALQKAMMEEYIPFLSKILWETGSYNLLCRRLSAKGKNISFVTAVWTSGWKQSGIKIKMKNKRAPSCHFAISMTSIRYTG